MPGRAYVGGLFGAGGPLADNDFVAGAFCCWAQEFVAVAKAAAIIAVASREMIRFFTQASKLIRFCKKLAGEVADRRTAVNT